MYRINFFDYTNNEEEEVFCSAENEEEALCKCEENYCNISHSEMHVFLDHRMVSDEEIANEQIRLENSSGWIIEAAYKEFRGVVIERSTIVFLEDRNDSNNSIDDVIARFNIYSKEHLRHLQDLKTTNIERYDKTKYRLTRTIAGIRVEKIISV